MEFPIDNREKFIKGDDFWADFVMCNHQTTIDEKIRLFSGLKHKAKYEFMYKEKTYDLAINMLIDSKVTK